MVDGDFSVSFIALEFDPDMVFATLRLVNHGLIVVRGAAATAVGEHAVCRGRQRVLILRITTRYTRILASRDE